MSAHIVADAWAEFCRIVVDPSGVPPGLARDYERVFYAAFSVATFTLAEACSGPRREMLMRLAEMNAECQVLAAQLSQDMH